MSRLALRLLGGFQLSDGEVGVIFEQARLAELLAYVALHHDAPISRQSLAFLLWPDSPEGQARTNLRNLLYKLRNEWPRVENFLAVSRNEIRWQKEHPYSIDVVDFEAALAASAESTNPTQQEADLRQAIALYKGDLLPERYDDWLLTERERLRSLFAGALQRLISLLEAQRRYAEAVDWGQRLLRHDPLQESTYRLLMHLYTANGDRAAALHIYHQCASTLEGELGVGPGAATQQLHKQLLKMEQTTEPAPSVPVIPKTPLVGRHQEWRRLEEIWRQAQLGHPKLALISGEAGIGKTRLAEELLDKATHQGIATVSTRAYAVGGALAYAPIAEWLKQRPLADAVQKLDPIWQVEISRLRPDLLQEHRELATPGPLQEGWQRQRFFQALTQALCLVTPPLLLHIDDLQWCDGETLTFLHYLFSSQTNSQLLVVGTVRSEEIHNDHPLNALCWSLRQADRLLEIDLGPLTKQETDELAIQTAGRQLNAGIQDQLYQESEGHPLFLIESIRMRETQGGGLEMWSSTPNTPGVLPNRQGTIPPKIQAVIQARLAQLSPAAGQIAQLAAVIGREFTYPVLREISNEPEETLVHAVDELWQRRIVREQGDAAYDFSHDRIREVAYAELSSLRRRWLHRRVAEALEIVHATDLPPISGQLAVHFEQGNVFDKACFYYGQAADGAIQQYANSEALHYLTRALALTPDTEHLQRYRLLLQRAQALNILGRRDRQRQDLEALTGWVGVHGALYPLAEAEVALQWAKFECQITNFVAAVSRAERAVTLAQGVAATHLEAEGYIYWARSLWGQAKFQEARRRFQQAAERAKTAHLPVIEAYALEMIAATGMFTGMRVAEIERLLGMAMDLARQTEDKGEMIRLYNKYGYLPYAMGAAERYDQALDYYHKGLAIAREIGERAEESTLLSNLVMLYTLLGDYRKAHHYYVDAVEISQAVKFGFREAVAKHYWGFALIQQGAWEGAHEMLNAAIAQLQKLHLHHFELKALIDLGLLHHLAGDQERALTVLMEMRDLAEEQKDIRGLAAIWTRLGYCFEAMNALAKAQQAYRHAQALHCQMEQINHSMNSIAGEARLALVRNGLSEAARLVASILDHLKNHKLEATIEGARVYWTCYQVLQQTGDPRAFPVLQEAYGRLERRANTIDDPQRRKGFWQIGDHKTIADAAVQTRNSPPQ